LTGYAAVSKSRMAEPEERNFATGLGEYLSKIPPPTYLPNFWPDLDVPQPETPNLTRADMEFLLMKVGYEKVVDEIGRVCVEFQLLESTVRDAIVSLVGEWAVGAILTEMLSFKNLLRALYNLFDYKWEGEGAHEEVTGVVGAIVAEANRCEGDRNRIIHSVWYLSKKGAVRWKHVFKPQKIRFDQEEFDEKTIKEITQRFTECRKRIEELMDKYYPGWSDKLYDK
jgi:hypothetical protein